MKRHIKLHLIELFAIIVLIGIYSLLFIPVVYYIEQITYIHIIAATGIMIGINFFYGTIRTWWKHRGHYMPEENAPAVYEYLETLSEEFNTRKPRLVVFDTDIPNAYATDTLPTRPIIAITKGLMEQLGGDELKAVMAHEMSHIRSYDVFFMLFLSSFINIVERAHSITTQILTKDDDDTLDKLIILVPFIITWINVQIVYMILFFISRVREVVADKDAAIATSPDAMKNALNQISEKPDETSQKYFAGEQALTIIPIQKFTSNLFSTHPSIEKRVTKLDSFKTTLTKQSLAEEESKNAEESKEVNTETETDETEPKEHTEDTDNDNIKETTSKNQNEDDEEDVNYPTDLSLRGDDN